jgi:hypothetical protein
MPRIASGARAVWWDIMLYRVVSIAILLALSSAAASAADLPPIRTSERNAVPECATPGRMMAFLRSRNEALDNRFDKIAVEYMRRGEELGLRWDYAFFQMVIETGYLTFKRDDRRASDVRPTQNNFAGLGATGKGQSGEAFKDVSTGVLAHLQHVLMYSGEPIENPVAERTRKVMEWGILNEWRKKIKGPMTFGDLARRWAGNSSEYAEAIDTHAERFYREFCGKADPNPELVQEARQRPEKPTVVTETTPENKPRSTVSGVELARAAIEEGKSAGDNNRSGLGAAFLGRLGDGANQDPTKEAPAKQPLPAASVTAKSERADGPQRNPKSTPLQTASVGQAMPKPQAPTTQSKCRVWTASYGGQKAILITAQREGETNYTVLDVNEGTEKREADAYIAAYAKGGAITGEFSNATQALDRAFELCPEG